MPTGITARAYWSSPGGLAAPVRPRSPRLRRSRTTLGYLQCGRRLSKSSAQVNRHPREPLYTSGAWTNRSDLSPSMRRSSDMPTRDQPVEISVDGRQIPGTLVTPATSLPGVLFVQGWGSGQEQYLSRAREIAALGCICLTFEPRGVAQTDPRHETVTREDNLRDVVAAYDSLASHPTIDRSAIGVVGASYGGYLAAILSSLRDIRWLALRVPALYKDEDWHSPKRRLDRDELAAYRRRPL